MRRQVSGFALITILAVLALASSAPAQQQLTFGKGFEPGTIGPGSVSTLRFGISNSGSTGVRNLAFTDSLPAGVTIAETANAETTCLGTVGAPGGGSTITFTDGAVLATSSCFVTVDVTSSTAGTHTNVSGDLTSDAGNSGSATADLTVDTGRPGFSKSFSPATVGFGGRSTLTFTIDNTANSSQASSLSFTDNLPSGMAVADPANASTTCGGTLTATAGSGSVSLGGFFPNVASVAAGSSCTVVVDVVANSTGDLVNTSGELTSTSGASTRSSGKASATLTVTTEQLSLTKQFTDDPVGPGGTVTLEFTVRNLNRSSSATGIAFTDDLDATLSGLVATGLPQSGVCGAGSTLSGTSVITFAGGSLGAEASCTFSVTLQVPAAAPAGSFVNTTSSVTASVGGRETSGSPASDVLFVSAVPVLTKAFLTNPVGTGDTVTLEFTLTNTSSSASATDIAFQDNLDNFLRGLTVTSVPAGGFCGSGSSIAVVASGGEQILFMAGGNLPASGSCTFSVDLLVAEGTPGGTFVNTTSDVTATVGGASVVGDPATAELTVVGAPQLVKEFIDDPVAAGDLVTLQFTLSLGEENALGASAISFTDDLAAVLAGLSATGLPAADVCGTGSQISGTTNLTFTGGSLPAGGSCTFNVTLQVPGTALPGPYTNTTSNVVATVGGVGVTSNPGEDVLQVAGLDLTKSFVDDPVIPGGTVTLQFTIENTSSLAATEIAFSDELSRVVSGLAATGLPAADVCGAGSSLTATGGNQFLMFAGGTLAAGTSCTFSVTLQVPSSTAAGTYNNTTSNLVATLDGAKVTLDPATDTLTVASDFLSATKEFTDDPVGPGENVTLQFTLSNLNTAEAATGITFTDDLDAALSGLASVSGTVNDVCGVGSQVSGTDFLTFTGGSLPAGGSCSFSVTVAVPSTVELGTVATNTTSEVTGSIGGLGVTGDPASDDLQIDFLEFTKAFEGPASAGGSAVLTFTIRNLSGTASVADLAFTDDLDTVIPGLSATGLPASDVCGAGSLLTGSTTLSLTGGNLLPGGSCTFSVELDVPVSAAPGDYENTTSDLRQGTDIATGPATATLTVIETTDSDGDGVLDTVDVCADTVIPESVPTQRLGTNRFALVDEDGLFDTRRPNGNGPGAVFTINDTAGCSCEQIIEALALGKGHTKFGCSLGAMRDWVDLVNP